MTSNNDIFGANAVRERALKHLAQDDPAGLLTRAPDGAIGVLDLDPGTGTAHGANALKPAAVLVPIIIKQAETAVIFTQRTETLPTHAGQISFPGGKVDDKDEDPVETALRETHEEIGLERSFVEILGFLDPYQTGTGYCILPIVGIVAPGYSLAPEPGEVAEIFDVPLAFLMSPENHRRHSRTFDDKKRWFHAMSYQDRFIWGATAGILKNLYDKLYKA